MIRKAAPTNALPGVHPERVAEQGVVKSPVGSAPSGRPLSPRGQAGTRARPLRGDGRTENSPALVAELPALQCEDVRKEFRGREGVVKALDGVLISIAEGQFVSIIGPSGSGKSTLLEIMAGLQAPTSGHVLSGGIDVTCHIGHAGYMPQKDLLLPWRSVLDNTILGLEIAGQRRARAREEARRWFQRFGLAGFEGQYPAALSGGMRQRAALLRTFLAGRDVLLLDEPFGALDALTRADMQEWLAGIQAEFGKTIVLVTHDVDEAIYLSDRVHVMSARPGTIVEVVDVSFRRPRRHDEIVTSPEFAALKRTLLATLRGDCKRAGP